MRRKEKKEEVKRKTTDGIREIRIYKEGRRKKKK